MLQSVVPRGDKVEGSGVAWGHNPRGPDEGGEVPMLLGTHTPKLDEKGRVILPSKFRDDLGPGVVITRGQERCLYVFSTAEFERVYERIREAPLTNKQARDFQRMFLSGASAEKPDSQNRVTIPPHLRTYAGLERDLVVTGRRRTRRGLERGRVERVRREQRRHVFGAWSRR